VSRVIFFEIDGFFAILKFPALGVFGFPAGVGAPFFTLFLSL
jgi:hypothetical protein